MQRVHHQLAARLDGLGLRRTSLTHIDPDSPVGFLCERRCDPRVVRKPLFNSVRGRIATAILDPAWNPLSADVTDSLVTARHQGRFQLEPPCRATRRVRVDMGVHEITLLFYSSRPKETFL